MSTDPVVQAAAEAVRRSTSATGARIVAAEGEGLFAVAVSGETDWRLGEPVPLEGDGVGYVLASAQPLTMTDPNGRATLCVPCIYDGDQLGALELVRAVGESAFSLEQTELAALFADVAAAALAGRADVTASVPTARELGAELVRLEAGDPVRFASLARALNALLA